MIWIIRNAIVMSTLPLIWWYLRVRRIRSKFVNRSTGKQIPGSNNLPFVDYIVHGFMGRNTKAPYGVYFFDNVSVVRMLFFLTQIVFSTGEVELSFFLGFPCLMVSDPGAIKEMTKGFQFFWNLYRLWC